MSERRILVVGLACLDIINTCSTYPLEDSDQRCIDQRWSRGGNAANTSTILAQLLSVAQEGDSTTHYAVECFATLAKGHLSEFMLEDFTKYGIITDNMAMHDNVDVPCSCVILNASNGSRTIVHSNRNLPELSVQDFNKLDLSKYSWIHFEGRNVDSVKQMIQAIDEYNSKCVAEGKEKIVVSVEVEKIKQGLDELLCCGDYVFISKDYAMEHGGYGNMRDAVNGLDARCKPGATILCGWGDKGAAAKSLTELVTSDAFEPKKVIDTLGAGDTFIASVIYGMVYSKMSLKKTLQLACRVAGLKCGVNGLDIKSSLQQHCTEIRL